MVSVVVRIEVIVARGSSTAGDGVEDKVSAEEKEDLKLELVVLVAPGSPVGVGDTDDPVLAVVALLEHASQLSVET